MTCCFPASAVAVQPGRLAAHASPPEPLFAGGVSLGEREWKGTLPVAQV